MHALTSELDDIDRALLVGLGGGGDVCGTLPTRYLLEAHGVETVVGGAAWQRKPHDPHPGPRPIGDFVDVETLGPTVGLANPATRIPGGETYTESRVSDVLGEDVLLVDITAGPVGVTAGLEAAIEVLDADLVVGVDVGGDLMARGGEPGLRSPLCDSVTGAGIAALDDCLLASFGLCADGELTLETVHERLEGIRDADAYLGVCSAPREAIEAMERCLRNLPSEASRIPVMAFDGKRGPVPIRHGTTEALCHDGSTLTHYLDPGPFLEWSPLLGAVAGTETILEANEALHDLGVTQTELDVEELMDSEDRQRYTGLRDGD